MKRTIKLTVNGTKREVGIDDRDLLVYCLREELRLTGTHIGCLTGNCGACTVIMNGVPVKSCTVFAAQADGGEILTVEGLGNREKMHPLQKAFMEDHAAQCGFCTPGMLLSLYYLLQNNPDPTEDEIRDGIAGNLCRCTGYVNIAKAAKAAAKTITKSVKER
ncbi:MAG: (2Fe-2S)-binding protein [Candidatus Bathyarchaeia archaeon]